MSSFSPVVQVRKLLDKMKSERNSPRLKRFPSRTLSEESRDQAGNNIPQIPPYKQRKSSKSSKQQFTGDNQFNFLPAEATYYMFSFLDSRDLCRMAQVSKDMHIFAQDELTWKTLTMFDWGISEPFAPTWKESYALLEDLCADGVWEGMSKWIEPEGFDNEQKTTARLHFVKRSQRSQYQSTPRSSPTVVHRVDSQTHTAPVAKPKTTLGAANHRDAPYRIVGSGVTVNCTTPSPFKIEGQRTIQDPTGCTFEWNKQFEKHTSVYSGKMEYAARTVSGVINYNDGTTFWKGIFSYTKMRNRGMKLVMA